MQIIGGNITVNDQGLTVVTPLLTADGIPVREDITRQVTAGSDARVKAQGFGLEIVDVRIKRADFPQATEENIFARMRTERDVQAQRLRAEGEEEFLTRTSNVDRQVAIINAEAEERALTLRGEGEAEAIRILAVALEQAPRALRVPAEPRRLLRVHRRRLHAAALQPVRSVQVLAERDRRAADSQAGPHRRPVAGLTRCRRACRRGGGLPRGVRLSLARQQQR